MDTSEKIKVFVSFEDLTQEIVRDKESLDMLARRYNVRFIMLNNFDEFKRLAKFMVGIGVNTLDLENLIDEEDDDAWITKDVLKEAIKSCNESTFVTPFSELVRFFNDEDFSGFLNEIMLLEDIDRPHKRTYIPLIGLQNRFSTFLNNFGRIAESAPIWRYDSETQSVDVYFTKYKNFVLPNGTIQCQLNSLREWLMFWKKQAPQEKIVCTSLPISARFKYSKLDNIFNFYKIENAYQFMTQFLDLQFPFAYEEEDGMYWEEMLNQLDNSKMYSFVFESFVRSTFNKVKFDASEIISEWISPSRTSYERWLLKQYVTYTGFAKSYPYVSICINSTTDLSDDYQLINMIATRILYGDIPGVKKEDYVNERKAIINDNAALFEKLLTEEDKSWLSERIKDSVKLENDLSSAIDLCTGVFDFEKKLLIAWSVYNPSFKKLDEAINKLYPDYVAYLATNEPSHFQRENQWFIDYLASYKQAKVQDKYSDEITSVIKTKNATSESFYNWYYMFDDTHSVLAEMSSNVSFHPDKIYWIDGLGAEFMSYILYLIAQENTNMKVAHSQITRSQLPTSTFHNYFYGDNVRRFGELDELGHDIHGYKKLDTLINELKVIKTIVKEILNSCKTEKCTIAIVSDHGLSCLSRLAPSKKYEGKFEHEGRYIKTTNEALTDPDYLVYKNEVDGHKYKIALTHSSLSKLPTHQVHGGCTPEEVLVPFIILSNKDVTTNIVNHQIKLLDDEIMLSDPVITLTVIPEPKNLTLTCEGKTYEMKRSGTTWSVSLEDITEGIHVIDVKPEGANSISISIEVIGIGFTSGIDDDFDL